MFQTEIVKHRNTMTLSDKEEVDETVIAQVNKFLFNFVLNQDQI